MKTSLFLGFTLLVLTVLSQLPATAHASITDTNATSAVRRPDGGLVCDPDKFDHCPKTRR